MNKSIGVFSASTAVIAISLLSLSSASKAEPEPVIFGANYSDSATLSGSLCNGVSICEPIFTTIPAGKTLLVLRVGCRIIIPNTRTFVNFALRRLQGTTYKGKEILGVPVLLGPNPTGTNLVIYQANETTQFTIGPGQSPSVQVQIDSNALQAVSCTIHGVITDAPPA
jgi:hypothetical protein